MKKLVYYILAFSLLPSMGCDDWLDVKPSNRVEEEEMFSSESGFQNALTGAYITLKDEGLYGRTLTMDFTENLAQHWNVEPQSASDYVRKFKYDEAGVEATKDGIYAALYKNIAYVNNILTFAENGVLSENMYHFIKGEALGLRAYMHLDLLRLFGPVPGNQSSGKMLTYARELSRENLEVNTWEEYIAYLEKDLDEAERLLAGVEDKGIKDDFLTYRQNRMNYYAVMATKARFYLWTQNKAKAGEYANKVIASKRFRLADSQEFTDKDFIASKEHIFSVHVFDLQELTENYFYRAGGISQNQKLIEQDLFGGDPTDIRKAELWKSFKESAGSRFVLMKYKQGDAIVSSREQVPLIRLYEMYLIAIECSDDPSVYQPLIDELLLARNMSLDMANASISKKNEFVAKEYNKEFYGEGQQFYQYKRRNDSSILWTDIQGSDKVYVLPIPKNEIKYGE